MFKTNHLCKVFFLIGLLFLLNINVYANDEGMVDLSRGNYGGASPNRNGVGGGSYGGYGNYIVRPPIDGGFRFTLVDKYGKIVKGTHSVDFTGIWSFYDNSKNYLYVNGYLPFDDYSEFNNKRNNSRIYSMTYLSNMHQGHYNYKYSIGSDGEEYFPGGVNSVGALDYGNKNLVYLPGVYGTWNFFPSPENFEAFKYYILNPSGQKLWTYSYTNSAGATVTSRPISFFDYFLHMCGYLPNERDSLDSYRFQATPNKYSELWTNNYYLIAEPLYELEYNINLQSGATKLYGTISEFAYQLKNNFAKDGSWVGGHYNYGVEGGLTGELWGATANFCTLYNDGIKEFSRRGVKLENGLCAPMVAATHLSNPKIYSPEQYNECSRNTDNFPSNEMRYCYAASKDYGYGVSTISVNRIIANPGTVTPPRVKPPEEEPPRIQPQEIKTSAEVLLDLCASKDGKISFSLKFDDLESLLDTFESIPNPQNHRTFKKQLFVVNDNPDQVDDNDKIYCFDNVTYDFINLKTKMNSDLRNISEISFKTPTLEVDRTCIYRNIKADNPEANNPEPKFIDDMKRDYNKNITVNMLGNQYEFIPYGLNSDGNYGFQISNESIVEHDGSPVYFSDGKQYATKTATLKTYYYLENDSNIIPNYGGEISIPIFYNTLTSDGYVDFGNQVFKLFGSSNNLLELLSEMGEGQARNVSRKVGNDTYITTYTYQNQDGGIEVKNLQCGFKTNIQNYNPTDYVRFRTIALDNPFPARDGSSRLPSKNWLSDEKNNVYDYIVANRGVKYYDRMLTLDYVNASNASGEDMYSSNNIKPMYTITLTPETMKKIRKYNETHQYDSMYHDTSENINNNNAYLLNCNSNKRECFSTFLRNQDFIPNEALNGVCSFKDSSNLRADLNSTVEVSDNVSYYAQHYAGAKNYSPSFDLNKNGRIDPEDEAIQSDYHSGKKSNTNFYTCADKSYFSGGPVGGGN